MSLYLLRAELVVMHLLRKVRQPAIGALELTAMWARWSRQGQRSRDLPLALERLEAIGLIEPRRVKGRQWIALTDAGREWMRTSECLWSRLLLLPRRLHARFSQLRRRSNAANHPRRRSTDLMLESS